ncbi:hypothetical protein BC939DRAFT_501560 [Gamsiella multidivaricata]|uniref:uncharacterized protein n=1 Tax=Gamsiella multidivaricata TaxID=101098 RepID=UPI00221EF523|nr:uncharacterized protein BC939DRAFT_501560 [Gamsiella multidivaricata]KAI7826902.1 hypothetical protein BC939DRAFT_501560 [Gamsiella multidivaricata]
MEQGSCSRVQKNFKVSNTRHWHDVSSYFAHCDEPANVEAHYESYKSSLETLRKDKNDEVRKSAGRVLNLLSKEIFESKFRERLREASTRRSKEKFSGAFLNVAEGASDIAATETSQEMVKKTLEATTSTKAAPAIKASKKVTQVVGAPTAVALMTAPSPPQQIIRKRGRASKLDDASKLQRREEPKARLRVPWHELVESALLLYDNYDVALPRANLAEGLSDEQAALYNLALGELGSAKALMNSQEKFDRDKCLPFKDAFVAISGILNTFSPLAGRALSAEELQQVEALCAVPDLHGNKEARLQDLIRILLDILAKGKLEDVLESTYRIQYPKHHTTNVWRQDPFGSGLTPSLGLHLSARSPTRQYSGISLGKQGCAATALSRSRLADVFNTGANARKCDCLLTVGGLEVANFEYKRGTANKQEVAFQLRKNLKINKSILLELDNTHHNDTGRSAVIYKLCKWKSIWVAGKASKTFMLPMTRREFQCFLEGPVFQLANLLAHLDNGEMAKRQYKYVGSGQQSA